MLPDDDDIRQWRDDGNGDSTVKGSSDWCSCKGALNDWHHFEWSSIGTIKYIEKIKQYEASNTFVQFVVVYPDWSIYSEAVQKIYQHLSYWFTWKKIKINSNYGSINSM